MLLAFAIALSCADVSSAQADSALMVSQTAGSDTRNCQARPCRTVCYALTKAGELVASTIVSRDESFRAWAALPPADIRATNRARYQARIDGIRSLDLKLTRRLVLEPPVSKHGRITLQGKVLAPFTSPSTPIPVWQENATCTQKRLLAKVTLSTDERYAIGLPAPAGDHSANYRLSTRVQASVTNPRSFATYSLTEAVNLK